MDIAIRFRNYIGNNNYLYLYTFLICVIATGTTYGSFTTCHFENTYGCTAELPAEESSSTGWRLHKNKQNSYAYASCVDKCVEHVALFKNLQSMTPAKWDVKFCYYLSTLDGAIEAGYGAAELRVITCGRNISVPLMEGVWKPQSVRFSCMEPFNVEFEIHLDGVLQRLALDQVYVTDPFTKTTGPQCSQFQPPSLFDLHPPVVHPPITTSAPVEGHETAILGDEIQPATDSLPPVFTDDEALVVNSSSVLPHKPSASEKITPTNDSGAQSLFQTIWDFFEDLLKNPLLLAEVLAIATVTVCCVTISIHCFIWRKQRRSYRLHKTRSIRAQRSLAREMSNSDMLLDMTVHDSDLDFAQMSRSRSSTKDAPALISDKKKLKPTKYAADRRATMSNGTGSGGSLSGSCDELAPRPHPRTKSLPSRPPANVYETIDEVRKNALQTVQEGDGDENKNLSHSFPSLSDSSAAPEPPKSRRHAKSCREKRDRKNKKQSKKLTKKLSKSDVAKENKQNLKEQDSKIQRDASDGLLKIEDGHFYDRLGRTNSQPNFEKMESSPNANGMRSKDRLSLSCDINRDPMQKQAFFRPRALSHNQGSAEWNPPSPRLAQQNMHISNGGVSRELNSVAESNYFTLEPPMSSPHRNSNAANNRSSSELSDDAMHGGSVDTLQEELIISQNQTDSFKRSVSVGGDQTIPPRPKSLEVLKDKQMAPTIIVESADNGKSCDTNENDFSNRTYETLEPPNMKRKLERLESSDKETHF